MKKVEKWIMHHKGKTKFATVIGRHTKVFPQKYREDSNRTIIIDEYNTLEDVQSLIVEFMPESVYYDRNVYRENSLTEEQELAFDIDPENITCPIHGTLNDKMSRHQGLSFCDIELSMAKQQTLRLYEYLEKHFLDLHIVYSGRGFHIHVFDKEAYHQTRDQRKQLAEAIKAKDFAIDTWVTSGEMRLIRLPFSLHGMVSRIVWPLNKNEVEKFDPVTDPRCIPPFLKGQVTATEPTS